jgi:hypothetical protein
LILLLLVWARQASPGRDISPQQLVKELESLADSHPVLAYTFTGRGLLRQVTPATLALAVEVIEAARSEKTVADQALADVPHLLGLTFTCDPSLPSLLAALADAQPGELVYLPWDDTGQLGAVFAAVGADVVAEVPSPPVIATLISMLHRKQWRIEQVNPITDRGTRERPDPPTTSPQPSRPWANASICSGSTVPSLVVSLSAQAPGPSSLCGSSWPSPALASSSRCRTVCSSAVALRTACAKTC